MSYWQNLQATLKTSGPKPIYTWVSDNGRIELSVVTFANAVSKASNFLFEGLELDAGTRVNVSLGNHWQSPVWVAAALSTNLQLVTQESEVTFGSIENELTKSNGGTQFVVVFVFGGGSDRLCRQGAPSVQHHPPPLPALFLPSPPWQASEFVFRPVKTWLGNPAMEKVDGWACGLYEARARRRPLAAALLSS